MDDRTIGRLWREYRIFGRPRKAWAQEPTEFMPSHPDLESRARLTIQDRKIKMAADAPLATKTGDVAPREMTSNTTTTIPMAVEVTAAATISASSARRINY